MVLNIKLALPDCEDETPKMDANESHACVSKESSGVSKTWMDLILAKVLEVLAAQGFSCFGCPKSTYKLYPLSADCREFISSPQASKDKRPIADHYVLVFLCGADKEVFRFELTLTPHEGQFDRRER